MVEQVRIVAAQLRAARALIRMEQQDLCERAGVSIATLRRMEAADGPVRGSYDNVASVVAVLQAAGVEFTSGGGPGVRLRKASGSDSIPVEDLNAANDE